VSLFSFASGKAELFDENWKEFNSSVVHVIVPAASLIKEET